MDVKKGQIGIQNVGNTCYLNSFLQCIRHVPDLTVFLDKHSESWLTDRDSASMKLSHAYKCLIKDMWSGVPPSFIRPDGFIHHFRVALSESPCYEHMIVPAQHDAHEGLTFLIDQLHEAMKRPLLVNITAPEGSPSHGALSAWKERVAPNYSPIVDYFWGLMEVNVECQGCKAVSRRYEEFAELQVEFPNKKAATLNECMDHQFNGEHIDEYQCNKCSPDPPKGSTDVKPKRHPGIISRKIWKLPQNLIVVLKRFNPNGTKCHAGFTSEKVLKFTNWFAEKSPESSRVADYTLQSMVDHHGSSGGGHYVSQVKSPTTGAWNLYDDETVSLAGDGTGPSFGPMNYILFFRKSS